MPNYPNTGTQFNHASGNNKTGTASSTQIIIKVNGEAVGAVQKLSISEKRPVTFFDEVGTDGHFDSMPTKSTSISGSCDRIRFDRMRVAQAFKRGFVHAHAQVFPFDISIYDIQYGDDDSNFVLITTLKNVWITGLDYTYNADNWVITDSMSWECETIYSHTINGDEANTLGNERNLQPETYIFGGANTAGNADVEKQADRGARRGSFDISNIVSITSNTDQGNPGGNATGA